MYIPRLLELITISSHPASIESIWIGLSCVIPSPVIGDSFGLSVKETGKLTHGRVT